MAGKRAARFPAASAGSRSARPSRSSHAKPQVHHRAGTDASDLDDDSSDPPATREPKRRKLGSARAVRNADLCSRIFGEVVSATTFDAPCSLPSRQHRLGYHRPLLLDGYQGKQGRHTLLQWFDSVSSTRAMPWRKAWVDPRGYSDPSEARRVLERRAYEVWISEIMLQQTRVAVVIDYWNRWMGQWPTIQDLAAAAPDDVLAAWRGLGYYSRATRIHEASKLVVQDSEMQGLLPEGVDELDAKVPGVGRYTAGAISAIVFGRPAPMVDGNVLRVLSRQLGVYGNVKTDKTVIDVLWAAADALVKAIAQDGAQDEVEDGTKDPVVDTATSDRPGRWGQALMELGSTVCTPKPNCAACPISSTCRAYSEGDALSLDKAVAASTIADLEDSCTICEPFEFEETICVDATPKESSSTAKTTRNKTTKQTTLASFAFTRNSESKSAAPRRTERVVDMDSIANHAKKFPIKVIKKAVREEETLVCAIRRIDGQYMVHRRPEKGLLAGLWEFPSSTLDVSKNATPKQREQLARAHASDVVGCECNKATTLRYLGDLGSVPWLFSHLKLTMHVHMFALEDTQDPATGGVNKDSKWTNNVEGESMGTGMRKCWALVQEAEQ